LNHDGKLSFDEFKKWYAESDSSSGAATTIRKAETAAVPAAFGLSEVRRLTNLESYSVEDVFEFFAEYADDEGLLSEKSFQRCFAKLIASQGRNTPRTSDVQRTRLIVHRLFEIFDEDGDGTVDFSELASGLSVLCGGNREDKVEAAFALYDLDGDGTIDLEEMTTYLTSVFKVLYETQPGTAERMGVSAEELAAVTAEQAFVDADLNHDGKLSFDEFKKWYAEPGGTSGAQETASIASLGMERMRQLVKLDCFDVQDVFEIFAEAAPQGVLSRPAFVRCFANLIESGGGNSTLEEANLADLVVDRLFTVFDTAQNGQVDFGELASGLAILCGSTMDEKVQRVFDLFDVDGTGFITLEDMTIFMKATFTVLFETENMYAKMDTNPEQLAAATAAQCFQDLGATEGLGPDQFRTWCLQAIPGMA